MLVRYFLGLEVQSDSTNLRQYNATRSVDSPPLIAGNAIPKDNSLVAKEPPPNGGVVNPDLRPQRSLKAPSADMHAQVLPKPSPSSGAYNSYGSALSPLNYFILRTHPPEPSGTAFAPSLQTFGTDV